MEVALAQFDMSALSNSALEVSGLISVQNVDEKIEIPIVLVLTPMPWLTCVSLTINSMLSVHLIILWPSWFSAHSLSGAP